MGFGQQQVSAVVFGTTDEATYVAKQLCLEIWKAAGVARQWSDIEPYVERVRYKTTTRVHLGHPLLQLLSGEIRRLIDEDICGPEGLGRYMGMVPSARDALAEQAKDIAVVAHCTRIELVVTTFDKVSGGSEDNELTLRLEARTDANRSRVLVTSELPSDRHSALVDRLVARLAAAEQQHAADGLSPAAEPER